MQADKIEAAIRKLVSGQSNMQADIKRLKLTPLPAPGKPGKNGESPAMADIVREVLAQIRVPEDGKDAGPVDLDAVSFKVLAQIPKPKDGKSPAMADIVSEVLAQIPKPKDGKSPSIDAVVREVLAQMPAPQAVEALAVEAKDGRPGRDGKNGKSVTKVKLEKGNQLAVWLDGVRRVVGKIEIPRPPVEAFTPGGGGRKVTKEVAVAAGYTPVGTFISNELQEGAEDAPSTVNFGAGGSTSGGHATVDADGVITINTAKYWSVKQRFRAGRSGAAGVSELFFWAEVSTDGGNTWNTTGTAVDIALSSDNDTVVFFDIANLYLPAGTKVRNRFARSSTGNNSGDLRPATPSAALQAAGVPTAPSAQSTFYMIEG